MITQRMQNIATAALFWLALTALVGCEKSELVRISISGTVTLDNKPVENASIIFTPLGSGLAAAGTIRNGQFSIGKESGPTAGQFHVRINPTEAEIEQVKASDLKQASRQPKIPLVYQRDGKLKATIVDKNDQRYDFKLLSSDR